MNHTTDIVTYIRPTIYYPIILKALGSADACIFASYFYRREGWISCTQSTVLQQTGLSKKLQEKARKTLCGYRILEQKLSGTPARLSYKFDWQALEDAIANTNRKGSLAKKTQKEDDAPLKTLQKPFKSMLSHIEHTDCPVLLKTPEMPSSDNSLIKPLKKNLSISFPLLRSSKRKENGSVTSLFFSNYTQAQVQKMFEEIKATFGYPWFTVLFLSWLPDDIRSRIPLESLQKWDDTFDKLLRIDKKSVHEILAICEFGRTDHFWKTNFFSPAKLRKRNKEGILYYDYLLKQMSPEERASAEKKQKEMDDMPLESYDEFMRKVGECEYDYKEEKIARRLKWWEDNLPQEEIDKRKKWKEDKKQDLQKEKKAKINYVNALIRKGMARQEAENMYVTGEKGDGI